MEWQNKRKPTDRTLDEKVYSTLPNASIFKQMQDVESNIDALVQRKRLDLQDMIGRSMRINKTLRIFISSTFADQLWQQGTQYFANGEDPTWTLRVEGRLLDDDPVKSRAFSSMITSVIVELRRENPSGELDGSNTDGFSTDPDEIVEWHESSVPPEQRVEFDGLDVKRSGKNKIKAKVLIQLKEYPDKFKLSPQLAKILGVTEESKPGAVVSLWQYIRYHQLQDVDEKRLIKCNAPLKELFNREKIILPQLVELLVHHLSPREPITIEYTIDPTQNNGNTDVAFDVPIQVDHSLRSDLLTMLNSWPQGTAQIAHYDNLITQNVQALNLLAYQHDFYKEFANEPAKFLDKWVASQAADLKTIYADRQFSEEAVRHSSFYTDDLVNPALHLFLGKN